MNLPAQRTALPAMSVATVGKVREFEHVNAAREQVPIVTRHLIHGGSYARTIVIPQGVALTGALIKRPTILIFEGDALVVTGDEPIRLTGFHVIPASAHRKQAFFAYSDTNLTMIFATDAKDIDTAEREFTDEAEWLMSRSGENIVDITGE